MAPPDGSSGDIWVAGIDDIAARRGNSPTSQTARPEARALVPQRRAVNWAEALTAIANEIERRQGRHRADVLLRAVGTRLSRDMLNPLPAKRDELEPAINSALSTLDWGWVAILEGKDGLIFEHRLPWPFESHPDELCLVLEGFFTETLHGLGHDAAMQARLIGKRGGALVFHWLPPDAPTAPEPSIIVPPQPQQAGHSQTEIFAALDRMKKVPPAAPKPAEPRSLISEPPEPAQPIRIEPPMPAVLAAMVARPLPPVVETKPRVDRMVVLLVAASVFVMLFALGLLTSGGEMVGHAMHSVSRLIISDARGSISTTEEYARAGDSEAQIRLALRLASSDGAAPNYVDAARWLKLAASSGSVEAEYDLGVMAEKGLGVKRDDVEAAILYLKAADGGFPTAEYRIGAAYESGRGVPQNGATAAIWYERAARHGVSQAQTGMGRLFARGIGVPSDPTLAYAWFRLAERTGDRAAVAQRAALMTNLTPEQIAAAQKLADTLIAELPNLPGTSATEMNRPTIDRVARLSR